MPIQNERERHIAILRAALPYVPPENRHAMEIVLQANSLVNLAMQPPNSDMGSYNSDDDLEAAEAQPFMPNPEAMLMNIREYCNKRESDTIQVLLNFIHADRLFKNYRDFANSHPDMLEAAEVNTTTTPLNVLFQLINGLGSLSSGFNNNAASGSNFMMEFLKSQLSPEQKSSFENIQNMMHSSGEQHFNQDIQGG